MRLYPNSVPPFPDEPTTDILEVIKLPVYGRCLIAKRAFNVGDIMFRFTGEITNKLSQLSLQVDDTRHIVDKYVVGYTAHSCNPNCFVDMEDLTFIAKKAIAVGDLLTMDYNQTEAVLYKAFKCACGAQNCRRTIK